VTTTEEIVVCNFNQQQLAQFQAFGFVVVRGLLDDRETAALTAQVTAALGDAFGGLECRTADSGALRVVPGSHDPAFAARVGAYWSRDPALQGFDGWPVPGVVLETGPGDVIAFDVHLFHSSAGGERRLAWTIEYLPWPGLGDPERLRVVRDLVVDTVDFDHGGYDRERWPTWREWVAGARAVPSRQVTVERLRLLGVLGPGDPR
jgi:hypothetical protein